MKTPAQKDRRQIFVLTPEEKRTISFVLVAVVLGFGARQFRQKHSVPPAKTAIVETAKSAGRPAEKRAEAKRRKAARP
jgi:hypothetical protein